MVCVCNLVFFGNAVKAPSKISEIGVLQFFQKSEAKCVFLRKRQKTLKKGLGGAGAPVMGLISKVADKKRFSTKKFSDEDFSLRKCSVF